MEENREVDGQTAYIRDRKRGVEKEGIMTQSKLGCKIFPHLLDGLKDGFQLEISILSMPKVT
jgi:hypothetical protein